MLDLFEFRFMVYSLQISFSFPMVSFCNEDVSILFESDVVMHFRLHFRDDLV